MATSQAVLAAQVLYFASRAQATRLEVIVGLRLSERARILGDSGILVTRLDSEIHSRHIYLHLARNISPALNGVE